MTRPTVAILTTNYNHAHYLPESIGSILGQSRPPDEYVIIDDGSTDDSVSVIGRCLDGTPYARLLRNPSNMGAVPSVNRAFTETSCDYVAFISADDRIAPTFIERMLGLLETHPEAAICSALTDVIDAGSHRLGVFGSPAIATSAVYLDRAAAAAALGRYGAWIMGNTAMMRRDALDPLGGHPVELGSRADGFLNVYLPLAHGSCFVPEVLASFRMTGGGYGASQRRDVDRYAATERLLLQRLRATGVVPEGYLRDQEELLEFRAAYDRVLASEAGGVQAPSDRPVGTLLRRWRTDLRLLRLLWRYRRAYRADRARSRRARESLIALGFSPRDLYP